MVSSTVFRTARPMMSEVLADGGPRRSKATLQLQVLQLGAKPRYLSQLENLYSRLSASRCENRSNSPDKLFLKFQRWKKLHGTGLTVPETSHPADPGQFRGFWSQRVDGARFSDLGQLFAARSSAGL